MFKRLRFTKIFSKARIRQQLFLVYTAVVVVPIVLIGAFLLINNYRMMVNYHEDLLEADNRRVKNILFEITTQIYNLSESISFDRNIQSLLTTQFTAPSTCIHLLHERLHGDQEDRCVYGQSYFRGCQAVPSGQ